MIRKQASLSTPNQAAFGQDVGPWSVPLLQGPRNHLLGMAQTVNGGCINPIHTQFERVMDGCDRLGVILCAPPELRLDNLCCEQYLKRYSQPLA
jgi:hypothetical protein